jgi:LacI family transcriptional regulator
MVDNRGSLGRVRLVDVAADAGVSKATVSMVLNDNPLVADKTRVRVRESLARLGYVYNSAAASLRKGQTLAVGMIVTTLTNPYFAEFTEGIQAELDAQGLDVLLGVSGEDPVRQARLLRSMTGRRVDGIVMVPARGTKASDVVVLETPMLMLTRRVPGLSVDYVGGDNVNGSFAAAEHLITAHQCRRLAFFGGLEGSSLDERTSGFLRALADHGLEKHERWRPQCESDRRLARVKARELLSTEELDGVVCYNDSIAFGVMDAAAELGMRIGTDLRVTGFDDVADAAFYTPPLTSVAVPAREAAHQAARVLLARISGAHVEAEDHIVETTLHPRASCGC